MQSPNLLDELRARLSVLRDAGVASATFGPDGSLAQVTFAPYEPGAPVKDDDPLEAVRSEVEQAQVRLASGAHRRRGLDDGS